MENFKDEDFDSKIKNEAVAVVQFSASWCAPCKALSPVLDKLSNDYKGKASFWYADVEEAALNTGSIMGIRGVPSTICFKFGKEFDRMVGYPGPDKVKEFLDKCIN